MQDVELIQEALALAEKIALSYFRKNPKSWHKADHSMLTEADLAVNEALHALITKAKPEDGWLSEEGPDNPSRLVKPRCWILDPIDGTRSFALGREEWCTGLALVEDGHPIAAGVVQTSLQRLYLANKGKGATLNGNMIDVVDAPSLDGARLAGRPSALRRVASTTATAVDVSYTPQITRLAMLAAGEVDVVASFGPKHDWDIAPGALLVTEAGGKASTETGEAMAFNNAIPRQNGLVAAGRARHAAVMRALEKN